MHLIRGVSKGVESGARAVKRLPVERVRSRNRPLCAALIARADGQTPEPGLIVRRDTCGGHLLQEANEEARRSRALATEVERWRRELWMVRSLGAHLLYRGLHGGRPSLSPRRRPLQ